MRTSVEAQLSTELAKAATLAVAPIDDVAETIRADAV